LAQIGLTVFTMLVAGSAFAQGVRYTVRIDAPGQIEELLKNNLDLVRWRDNPRLDRDQLQRLVRNTPDQVRTLVATEGYYSPTVSARLDSSGAEPVAVVTVDPGQPVLVGEVHVVLEGFAELSPAALKLEEESIQEKWSLTVGQRFRQADWEQAKRNLVREVAQKRYPRARLTESSATVDPDKHRALLHVALDSGPTVRMGALRIEGLQRYPVAVIDNLNWIKPGTTYDEVALQTFQARLQGTGYFAGVEVSADMSGLLDESIEQMSDETGEQQKAAVPKPAATGPVTVPVLVRVTENKQKNVSVGLGYSTNTGYRAQVNYDDLSVLGLRMKSSIILETKRQTARADFYFPTTPKGYNDSIGGGIVRTDLQGELTEVATVAVRRAWGSPELERSLTLEYLGEINTVEGQPTTRSKSLPLTYSVTKRVLDNLFLPTRGYAINVQLGGAPVLLLTDERFLRAYTRFINYRPLTSSGTLVLRGEAGAVASRTTVGVPSVVMFRTGGEQSVRGYAYQSLGVQEGSAVVAGRYLLVGSVEYDYWVKPPWGVAVFLDAGNAADTWQDLRPKLGYGVGLRWRSPVGPIDLDIAYGRAEKKVRLHFSLGFSF
jgi:translocation and assembly module TamA